MVVGRALNGANTKFTTDDLGTDDSRRAIVLAEYERLKTETSVAQEAYQKMFERAETFLSMFNIPSDYVAIQERATTAVMVVTGGLFPAWKMWTPVKEVAKE